jgi:hypothetical protein
MRRHWLSSPGASAWLFPLRTGTLCGAVEARHRVRNLDRKREKCAPTQIWEVQGWQGRVRVGCSGGEQRRGVSPVQQLKFAVSESVMSMSRKQPRACQSVGCRPALSKSGAEIPAQFKLFGSRPQVCHSMGSCCKCKALQRDEPRPHLVCKAFPVVYSIPE